MKLNKFIIKFIWKKKYSEIDGNIAKKRIILEDHFYQVLKYTIKSLQLKSCGTNKQRNLFDIFLGKPSVRKSRRKYL